MYIPNAAFLHMLYTALRISTTAESLLVGQVATLYCNSDLPLARKEWLHNGSLISLADGEGTAAALVLDPISTDDAGINYTCRVTTAYDTEEKNAVLDIQG